MTERITNKRKGLFTLAIVLAGGLVTDELTREDLIAEEQPHYHADSNYPSKRKKGGKDKRSLY